MRLDMKYVVLYSCVSEEEGEIFVDVFFFGGKVDTREDAEELAKCIVNDRSINGAVVPKIYPIDHDYMMNEIISRATKYFNTLANEMYALDDQKQRKLALVE
jgi:cell division protein YceG involved in septum cleavage